MQTQTHTDWKRVSTWLTIRRFTNNGNGAAGACLRYIFEVHVLVAVLFHHELAEGQHGILSGSHSALTRRF
eukprot:scaffold130537_cov39-Prasinocladus_malaysianus.AAC.1